MGYWNSTLAVPSRPVDPLLHHDLYTDLLTFTFCGPTPYNQFQPLFIDAEDPSRSFTAAQFRQLVRTIIAGLKAHNVQKGDCVLVHLGNSVSRPSTGTGSDRTMIKRKVLGKKANWDCFYRSCILPSSSVLSALAACTWGRTLRVNHKNWTISSAWQNPR